MLMSMDMPDIPQQQVVLIASANTVNSKSAEKLKLQTVGVCQLIRNFDGINESSRTPLDPVGAAVNFLWKYEFQADRKSEFEQDKIRDILDELEKNSQVINLNSLESNAQVKILKQPTNGTLVHHEPLYSFSPEEGYSGKDKVVFEVKLGKYKIRLNYYLGVGIGDPDNYESVNEFCGKRGEMWKVVENYDYLSPNITFANLAGAAVGEATGSGANATITLDTDAAGHGWYEGGMFNFGGLSLDAGFNAAQPGTGSRIEYGMTGLADMSNWLPTSNPNEWVARANTAAAGKMDMLSVLLHEYGHALGIAHSADSHDYMATTLTPGMRRLPSSSDMQLMAQLAAEAREAIMAGQGYTLTVANSKNTLTPALSQEDRGQDVPSLPISMGFGISFLGLLRRNSSTSSIFANAAPAPAQYDIAANSTLTNGNFAGNNANAWETTGKVNANNGAAVLS